LLRRCRAIGRIRATTYRVRFNSAKGEGDESLARAFDIAGIVRRLRGV
jgi:hypothetical protein